jgi:plastocyanin
MNNDFRQRVFLPIILPLGVIVGFFGFAFMLSRVLLAVEETASTAIALGLAVYVLALAAVVSSRPRITSRALTVGVALGIVAVVGAGLIASGVGMRELEHAAGEEGHGGEGEGGEGETAGGEGEGADQGATQAEDEGDQLQWVAIDIEFEEAPTQGKAGEQNVVLVNNGNAPHNVTIPDVSDEPIVEAPPGETVSDVVTLEPGTYEFLCSVPGHESLMKGELTVE